MMRSGILRAGLMVAGGLLLIGAAGAVPASSAGTRPARQATPAAAPPVSAQLEAGADLYRLYCVSCHGDQLLGLTPSYIALWPLEDQNCWKSKCHGPGHPNPQDGGFELPRDVPAIAGPGALGKFRSAAGLFAFIRARMPYQDPQWLKDDEYWAVAAYILDWNGLAIPEALGPDNADDVIINAQAVVAEAVVTPSPPTGGFGGLPGAAILGLAFLLVLVLVLILVLRRRARSRPS